MTLHDHYPQPSSNPESLAYGDAAIAVAGIALRGSIEELAETADAAVAVEIKTDPRGATSPVTLYDKATEGLIGHMYEGTTVRVKGEEGVATWPANRQPTLELHVDPIDGTELFIEYVNELLEWSRLPANDRPPRPFCGSMVSAGALRPNGAPEWGAVAAPFLAQDGVVRWQGGHGLAAKRTEPDGSTHTLPAADTGRRQAADDIVLVASSSSERQFSSPLEAAGFRVIKYKSAVAAALSVIDPELFGRLRPGAAGSGRIAGAVMGTAKNWDVAGAMAIGTSLGYFVRRTDGEPRTFEDGATSAVFASNAALGDTILRAIAPALQVS